MIRNIENWIRSFWRICQFYRRSFWILSYFRRFFIIFPFLYWFTLLLLLLKFKYREKCWFRENVILRCHHFYPLAAKKKCTLFIHSTLLQSWLNLFLMTILLLEHTDGSTCLYFSKICLWTSNYPVWIRKICITAHLMMCKGPRVLKTTGTILHRNVFWNWCWTPNGTGSFSFPNNVSINLFI